MRTFVGRARTRRRRALAIAATAVLAIGAGAAVASPPRSAQVHELDGRTWFSTNDGTQLLLLNGISGLIEAATEVPDAEGSLAFVDGRGPRTLLSTGDGLVAVDDGAHTVRRLPGSDRGVFVGDQWLVLGEDARRLGTAATASPRPLPGAPAPIGGAVAVVDGSGDGWYLGDATPGRAAVRVPREGGDALLTPLEDDATRLLVADGHVYATGPSGLTAIGGAPPPAEVDRGDRVDPSIATATGGWWSWGTGSTVHARSTSGAIEPPPQDLASPIEALAVWHGHLVAITADGAHTGPPGDLDPIAELGPGATVREDGGLLWVATNETAVAIHPDHERTVLRLADADLSLCVGDCSPAAASSFLEETTPTTAPTSTPNAPTTTTTAPPRRLVAEQVPPTLAASATTSTVTSTTVATPTTTTAPAVAAADGPASTLAPVTTTTPPGPPGKDPDRPEPGPPIRLPEVAPTTSTEAPPPPAPEPEPTTTQAPAPEPSVGLSFNVVGRTGTAEATLRVFATAEDCGATAGTTTAVLTWEGSDRGSREVLVTWNGGSSRSEESSATIVAAEGELAVTVTVCGVTATDTASVRGLPTPTTTEPPPTTTTTAAPTTTTSTPPTTTTLPTTTTPTTPTTPTSTTTTPTTTTTLRPTTTRPTTTSTSTQAAAAGGAP